MCALLCSLVGQEYARQDQILHRFNEGKFGNGPSAPPESVPYRLDLKTMVHFQGAVMTLAALINKQGGVGLADGSCRFHALYLSVFCAEVFRALSLIRSQVRVRLQAFHAGKALAAADGGGQHVSQCIGAFGSHLQDCRDLSKRTLGMGRPNFEGSGAA